MRIGPREKQILKKLVPGEFTPPSVYMGDYGSCPNCHSLNRIVHEKQLAVFRYQTQTPEERKCSQGGLRPGREAAEYYAALMLTPRGVDVLASLRSKGAEQLDKGGKE